MDIIDIFHTVSTFVVLSTILSITGVIVTNFILDFMLMRQSNNDNKIPQKNLMIYEHQSDEFKFTN